MIIKEDLKVDIYSNVGHIDGYGRGASIEYAFSRGDGYCITYSYSDRDGKGDGEGFGWCGYCNGDGGGCGTYIDDRSSPSEA